MRSGLYDNSKKEVVTSQILFLLVAGIFCFYYWQYIDICGYRVPIMDFFKWIRMFGEKVHDGSITFIDFFYDLNEQMQPGAMAIIFAMLEKSNYSMWPMMVVGAILQCVKSVFLGEILLLPFMIQKKNLVTGVICSSSVVALGLSLNQWELLSEPFVITNGVRVIAFCGVFFVASFIFGHIFHWRLWKQIIVMCSFSAITAIVAITLSGAYFAAMLGSVSIAGVLLIIDHRKEIKARHFLSAFIWAGTVVVTLGIYLSVSAESVSSSVGKGINVAALIKGFILYWGAAFIPQNLAESSFAYAYFPGIVFIVVSILVTVQYIRKGKHKVSYFPLMLLTYGVLTGIMIIIGRVPEYGIGTMVSSRYCVESIIGVSGVIFMMAWLLIDLDEGIVRKKIVNILAVFVIVSVSVCFSVELEKAPYRAEYQKAIVEAMLNVDHYDNEQLAVCQAMPEDVRATVQFFKDNKLSIFSNWEMGKTYSFDDCEGLAGLCE